VFHDDEFASLFGHVRGTSMENLSPSYELQSATVPTSGVAHALNSIVKRDGRLVPFDAEKIRSALVKAGEVTGEFRATEAEGLTVRILVVLAALPHDVTLTVESVQDVVEQVLLASPYHRTAKAYILYRDEHAKLRRLASDMQNDVLECYLKRSDWSVAENANMAYSLQGLNNYVASEVTRNYWLERVYSAAVREAHRSGELHLHDLNALAVYCVGWDLSDLMLNGFRGAPGKVESAPARHFRAALGQIVNFFYTLQGEAAGAQAFSSIDTLLAPFIRRDNLDDTEVKQALQEFVFNLNVPTRVGFQTPFTNVTLDFNVPSTLANQPVIWGGEYQSEVYGDFQPEVDRFNRAFLEVLGEGDAKGRVFSFPIPTYNITRDFDYNDPRLDCLWHATARYGIPYFANFVSSELSPEDARSMCCRLRLDTRELHRRGGGLFGAQPLTGSIGVVTLNLPRAAYLATNEEEFLRAVDRLLRLCVESLETKRKLLERLTDEQLYPYAKYYLRSIKERTGQYWTNHFATIGIVGLHEAALNLLGEGLDSPKGRDFGLRVLDYLRARLITVQTETGHLYNLEATPAEGTSHRLARLDRAKYPRICVANQPTNENGAPYYTNSSQLPVGYSSDPFEILEHQDEFQTRYTGGTVVHVYVGEAIEDPRTVREFVRTVCENYRLPYFTVTPTFSVCPTHGYRAGTWHRCPDCDAECEVYSRVVGYLRPVSQWNVGKQAEFADRAVVDLEKRHPDASTRR
jgi:ribonucleoside-triphosphate reductase